MITSSSNKDIEELLSKAVYVWDEPSLARRWMNAPHPELGGRPPLAIASTPDGVREVEAILANLFYGLPV